MAPILLATPVPPFPIPFAPNWFFGFDIGFEIIFGIISLALALFALRLSKITSERSANLFGKGFLLISASYFLEVLFNLFMLSELSDKFLTLSDLSLAALLRAVGAYGHIIFMLAGLIVLLYMTFEVKNSKILAIMLLLGLIPLFLSDDPFIMFAFLSSVCFAFVAWHFTKNYYSRKKRLSGMTAVAFILLLVGSLHFFISTRDPLFYVSGQLVVLAAYLLILINFYLVLRK